MSTEKITPKGYLALVLHAHLPFVHSMEPDIAWEEKWLFEAVTECYLPLIISWKKLTTEQINFKLTLSLSPTLISMLTAVTFAERYIHYLRTLIELAAKEIKRTQNNPQFALIAEFYYERLRSLEQFFCQECQGNLIKPLKKLKEDGYIELITTGATHGFLPLMLTDEARHAQIKVAISLFNDVFGFMPKGLWLPECAYMPSIEEILSSEGIKYTIISTHGFLNSVPPTSSAIYAPIMIGNDVAAFGRDWETSQQVWSRTEGYPGDSVYREFYRDIGYDLEFDYLRPHLIGGIRGDTGLKYYRITGKTDFKEPYNYYAARSKAREHAEDFLKNRDWQSDYWSEKIKGKPIIVAPYDAELFGHWWFEGIDWMEDVLRLAASDVKRSTRLITLSAYLEKYPPQQKVKLGPSTWGEGGYNRYWLNSNNDWLYPHLHQAEKTMLALAEGDFSSNQLEEKTLNQAFRELLLAQSSDWPFILSSNTVVDYARNRFWSHINNFFKLSHDYFRNKIDAEFVKELESQDNIFPNIDFRTYRSTGSKLLKASATFQRRRLNVIMLSWEFPPRHVGGLGIHVQSLSEALAKQGISVHVLTFSHSDQLYSEYVNGVHTHYLPVFQQPAEIDFLPWVLQLNMAMADFSKELILRSNGKPIILHAHDWLTAYAVHELKRFNLPIVTTIHATEFGRNNGIHNSLQQSIHQLEGNLVSDSDYIVCCSRYMEREIERVFQSSSDKVKVIPNAVKSISILPKTSLKQKRIVFIGRLVIEKGVQVLIQALAGLSSLYPEVELIIAGTGPYAADLKDLTIRLGLEDTVKFIGFISEKERNELLAQCQVAVFPSLYEPFGIVALEAMAAEIPVVVSRTGGLAEIIEDGETGLCFTPNDSNDLQNCLITIFQNPVLAKKLSQQAKAKVNQNYTWDSVATQTIKVYDVLLNKANMSKIS